MSDIRQSAILLSEALRRRRKVAEGIVTKYSEDKGIGFILEETGREVRVERSELEMPGYKYLNIGDRVTFELKDTVRGPEAKSVIRL
jgi:CspA family cold shock protein